MALPKIKFYSTTTNSAVPLTCGQGFKQGDVPAGSQVIGMQCTPKNVWPDGSLKFAVMAASVAITGGAPLEIQLALGTPAAGTAVALADLKARTPALSVGCGAFGTATWSSSDLDAPFMTWASGPIMSSWIYRKPVGADAHLVAWLRVNCWASGAVEVLPWIENGYLLVASPTNKSATFTFSMGGSQRISIAIDVKHHQRTPILNGTALGYWLGTDPGISVSHDKAYLQSTELVPTYGLSRSATGLVTLPSTFTPFQRGGILYTDNRDGDDVMKNPGYQRPIGLLGEHDAAYMFCNDQPELLYGAVVRNGFSAGRYPIHYRDETTNRAPVMLSYQELTVSNPAVSSLGAGNQTTPTPTGGQTTTYDLAHSPSLGYMAYLVTGDFYHLETTQLMATGNFLITNYINNRAGGNRGRFIPDYESVQTRAAAWGARQLFQALSATPDNDTLQASFAAVATTLINYFHATYVAQPNNQFGFIEPGESNYGELKNGYTGPQMQAGWQNDFFTASYGYGRALGLPLGTTVLGKLAAFFDWKAKAAVGRAGDSTGYRFEHCDTYVTQTGGAPGLPDYQGGTGPWPASWKAIYDATVAFELSRGQTWLSPLVDNTIAGEFDIATWPKAMLGNLMPALAYAERFNVPGAAAARARILGATNWPAIQSSFTNVPVWDIVPSGQTSGGIVPAPTGPSTRIGARLLGAGKTAIGRFNGRGITPAQVATGFPKASFLENDIAGALATDEFMFTIDTKPSGLSLNIYANSSADVSGTDGTYTGAQTVYKNGDSDTGAYSVTVGAPASTVTGVTVSPSTATGSTTFSATVSGTGSPSQAVTWSRSGSAGSINASTGVFTAPAQTTSPQTITITATSTQDGSKIGTATVTVPPLVSTVTGVTVSPTTATGSTTFAATVAGANSPSPAVTWTRSGTAGSINANTGVFTAPAQTTSPQTITITATSVQDNTKSGTATVTIAAAASTVTAVAVSPASLTITGGTPQQFTATVTGTNNPSQNVIWSKSGPGTLTSGGLFTSPDATTSTQLTTITATSAQDGSKASSVTVTVQAIIVAPVISGVTVAPATAIVAEGSTRQFSASVQGSNNPSQFVTWSKSGPGDLSATGLLTAPAATGDVQTITVIATSIADSTKSGSAIVTVPAAVLPGIAPNVPASRILIIGTEDARFDPRTQNANTAFFSRGRLPAITKDPQARLGYGIDLAPWLAELGTTLSGASATATGVTIDGDEVFVSGSEILFWIKGGILPLSSPDIVDNSVTVHFIGVDGSEDDRTIVFSIEDR